jgi:hypothetical protein
MLCMNNVRIIGKIIQIFPIKHFDNSKCMLLARIETYEEGERFVHLVSFINENAISFANTAQLESFVDISARLRPRPKKVTEPNGETFFEILCTGYAFVSSKPISNHESIYPENLGELPPLPAPQSKVKGFFKNFISQTQSSEKEKPKEKPQFSFVATQAEIKQHQNSQTNND